MQSSIDLHFLELSPLTDRWRKPTTAVANLGVPPHITLLWPWKDAPVAQADLNKLEATLTPFKPFQLTLSHIEIFENGAIYFALEDESIPRAIMQALFKTFPETPPYGGEFPDPRPHITIAKPPKDQSEAWQQEIARAIQLPIHFWVKEIVVMEENQQKLWHNRAILTL